MEADWGSDPAPIYRRPYWLAISKWFSTRATPGTAFAFPSIFFGVLDWIHFYHAALIPAIKIKIVLAALLLVLLTLGIILGGKGKQRDGALIAIYTLSFFAVVALGWFGASLIYSRGSAATVSAAAPATTAKPAGLDAGKLVYDNSCAACHPGGENSVYPKLPVKGSKRLVSLASFESFVRAPAMPDGKPGDMPPFGTDSLTSAQVKDLYAYASATFK